MSNDDIRFSQSCTFGDHFYRREDEVAEVIFENTRSGIRRTIVDNKGKIRGFPGLAHPDLVSRYSAGYSGRTVRFRSEFRVLSDRYAMIWQIQPDGRYWEDDDGFGGTPDDEINLYARLDDTGNFMEPFRLYSIGNSVLYDTQGEEAAARTLGMKGEPLSCLRERIPGMLAEIRKYSETPKAAAVFYFIVSAGAIL